MSDRNMKHVAINIMEELVAEEVTRQLKRLPSNLSEYINKVEVATFALNRLPALYASSHKGLNQQKLKGKTQHSVQITKAVRQGLAAVQKDVLRYSTPIEIDEIANSEAVHNEELETARKALAQFAQFFPEKRVSWAELVKVVIPLLEKHRAVTNIRQSFSKAKAKDCWETPASRR